MSKRNYRHLSQTEEHRPQPQGSGSFFVSKRIFSLFILMLIGVVGFFVCLTQKNHFEEAYQPLDGVLIGRTDILSEDLMLKESHSQRLSRLADPAVEIIVVGYDYPLAGRIGKQEATLISWYSLIPSSQTALRFDYSPRLLVSDLAPQQVFHSNQTLADLFSTGGSTSVLKVLESASRQKADFIIEVDVGELHEFVNLIHPLESQTGALKVDSSLALWQSIQPHGLDREQTTALQQDFFLSSIDKLSRWTEVRRWDEYFISLQNALVTNISFNQMVEMSLRNVPTALSDAEIFTVSNPPIMEEDKLVERVSEETLAAIQNRITQFYQEQIEE